MIKYNIGLLIIILWLSVTIRESYGNIIRVNTTECTETDTYCSIYDAVKASTDGTEIVLESDMIILNTTIDIDKSITIRKSNLVDASHVLLISEEIHYLIYEKGETLDEKYVINRENSSHFFNHSIFNIKTTKPVAFHDIKATFEDAFLISSMDNMNVKFENLNMYGTLFLIFFSGDNQDGSITVLNSDFKYGGTLFIVPPELKRSNIFSNILINNCTWYKGASHYTYFSTKYKVKAYISDTIASVISIVNYYNVRNVAIYNSKFIKNVRVMQVYATGLVQDLKFVNCQLKNGYHTQVDIRSEISNLKNILLQDTELVDMDRNFEVEGSATGVALVSVNYLENILYKNVTCINNYAIWSGGSLYFQGSLKNVSITESYFERNEAIGATEFGLGGAIHVYSVFSASEGLHITNNVFKKNRAARLGSAIYITSFGSLENITVTGNLFEEQQLTEQGVVAIILQTSKNLRIIDNIFRQNEVESAPLFVESNNQKITEIHNITFIDNISKYERGYSLFIKGRDIDQIRVSQLSTQKENEDKFGIFYFFEFSQNCRKCVFEDIICNNARTCFGFRVVEINGILNNIKIRNCITGVNLDSTSASADSKFEISNSVFEKTKNYGFFGNSIGYLSISNSQFKNNEDYGLWISKSIETTVENCIFDSNGFGNSEIKGGGATFQNNEKVLVKNSTFNKNRGRWGGCIEAAHSDTGNVVIFNSLFSDCDALQYGGGVSVVRTNLEVSYSQFYDNFAAKGACIYCEKSGFCVVTNSHFEQTTKKQLPTITEGAGIDSVKSTKTHIEDNTFLNLKAQKGGSIHLEKDSQFVGIRRNKILNSTTLLEGAAIYSGARNVHFEGGMIAYSKSERIGIIYLSDWEGINGVLPHMVGNEVLDSTVDVYGNGLFVEKAASPQREIINLMDSEGKNATVYSFPQSVLFTNFTSDTHNYDLFIPDKIEVEPGELFSIILHALDRFGKQITSYPRLETSIYFNDKLIDTSYYQYKEDIGGHIFKNIRITLTDHQNSISNGNSYGPNPNGTFGQHTLKLVMVSNRELVVSLPFFFRPCRPGFKYEGNICSECDEEHYSLNYNATQCYKCNAADGCEKTDKKSITVSKGYWGYARKNKQVYLKQCINNYCEGGIIDESNEMVDCNGNRAAEYPLCAVCNEGYSEWGGQCVECVKTNELLITFLYVPYFVVFTYYMLWTSYDPLKGAQVKIFAVFLQTFFIIVDVRRWLFSTSTGSTNAFRGFLNLESIFDASNIYSLFFIKSCPFYRSPFIYMFSQIAHNMLAWILIFIGFLLVISIRTILKIVRKARSKSKKLAKSSKSESIQEAIEGGESTKNLLELEHLPESQFDEDTELDELTLEIGEGSDLDTVLVNQSSDDEEQEMEFSVAQLLKNCLLLPFRLLFYFFRKQRYLFTKPSSYSLTLFNLLIFSYQPMARIVVQYIFSCITIERGGITEYVLMNFTDVQCDGYLYNAWYYFYLVVGILMLAVPFFIFIFLTAIRKNLKNPIVVKYIGSVYAHYRPSLYWFEAVVLTKRLLLIGGVIMFDFLQIEDNQFVNLRESYFSLLLFFDITILFIARPYRHKSENRVAIVANGILLLALSLQRGDSGTSTRLINMIVCLIIILITSASLFVWVVLTRPYVKPYVTRKWNQFYPYLKEFVLKCLNISDSMLTNMKVKKRKKVKSKRYSRASLSKKLMENDALELDEVIIDE